VSTLFKPIAIHSLRYPIVIARNPIPKLIDSVAWKCSGSPACIISDQTVYPLYGQIVSKALIETGWTLTEPFIIPPGERSKSMRNIAKCYAHLAEHRLERKSTIVALGGGVVGDLAGFAAATYLRGLPWVIFPTTLIAQCDSSIGGKTGVDLPEGKNLVGAFHHPSAVMIHPPFLQTLPPRHFKNGLAEVVKTAVIGDSDLFGFMESKVEKILQRDSSVLEAIISKCCEIKAGIVARDERDIGERLNLNLGHTLGHALETIMEYRNLLHGEAVSIGMVAAASIAANRGLLSHDEFARLVRLLLNLGLPVSTSLTRPKQSDLLTSIQRDKKRMGGVARWILPAGLGQVTICTDVSADEIERSIHRLGWPRGREATALPDQL